MEEIDRDVPSFKREGFAPTQLFELHLDPHRVIILNGRVIEILRGDIPSSDLDTRFHVRHVAVELKPRRNGNHTLKIGLRRDGGVWNLCSLEVTPEKLDDVQRFFGEAKAQAAL